LNFVGFTVSVTVGLVRRPILYLPGGVMNTSMLEVAINCIERGWAVFPCAPKTKIPLISKENGGHGYKDATTNEEQVREWWANYPDANVPIATGVSKLCVVDFDLGFTNEEELRAWMQAHEMPLSYAVRTGRRPEFAVQVYYSGEGLKSTGWERDGAKGDLRCSTGLVMAAGAAHKSGHDYEVLWDYPLVPVPEFVRTLTMRSQNIGDAATVDDETADGWKKWLFEGLELSCTSIAFNGYEKRVNNGWWVGVVCPWVNEHGSGAGAESSTVLGILDGKLAFECSHGTCKAAKCDTAALRAWLADRDEFFGPEPGADPVAFFSRPKKTENPKLEPDFDPLSFFDTADQIVNAEPVDFIINSVIPKNRYTGFVALSGSRKTIIACNLVRSCLTREPFLGRFEVDNPPKRVILLAAESARSEMKERATKMGLIPFVESRQLLIRTAATASPFHQDQLPMSLLDGALVVFDTFIRFFDGMSEQDSTEARKFSAQMQRLVNAGATVVVLFHAPKGAKGADEMSIESVRGSSELGAAMAACWGLAMLGKDWKDNTRMSQVKRREFQCDPPIFDFSCDEETALCTFVDGDMVRVGTGERELEDAKAVEYLKANFGKPDRVIQAGFKKESGIERSYKWFQRRRKDKENWITDQLTGATICGGTSGTQGGDKALSAGRNLLKAKRDNSRFLNRSN
jgi:hypothetical protein